MNIPPTIAGLRAANNALVKRHDKERQRAATFKAERDRLRGEFRLEIEAVQALRAERDRLAEDLICSRDEVDRVQAALREMTEERDLALVDLQAYADGDCGL